MYVTCAIIIEDEKVLCARRGPGMSLPGKWELPGGKVENGESYEECLVRELDEELGIKTEVIKSYPESPYQYKTGLQLILIPMECRIISGTPFPHEHSEIRWVKRDQLLTLDWADADIPVIKMINDK